MKVYGQVMKLESFHALAHDPAMLAMYRDLIGEAVLVHPRNIARIIFPQNTLVANAQTLTTKEDTKKNITLTGSGASPLSFNIITNPKHGTVTGTGANRVYKPAANYNGKDSFSFNVSFKRQISNSD